MALDNNIRCVVERITYRNETNGYSVIKCRAKGYKELVPVIGIMPDIHIGSVISASGSWKMDAKYGRQFFAQKAEETLPATVYGIEKYLGGGLIKGIGPKYAKKIVQKFGADTLNIIEEDPSRLIEVEGIGKTRVDKIKKSWEEQKEIKNIMLFLQGKDVSTSLATKIYKQYGNDSIKIVEENPYRLADEIWGIGFKTADTIASKLGFGPEKYVRLRSGIMYTLNQLSNEGHCYADREQLLDTGAKLLSADPNLLSITLDEMIRAKDVIIEDVPDENEPVNKTEHANANSHNVNPHTERNANANLNNSHGQQDIRQSNPAAELLNNSNNNTRDGDWDWYDEDSVENNDNSIHEHILISESDNKAIYLPALYYSEIGVVNRLIAIYKGDYAIQLTIDGIEWGIQNKTGINYDPVQIEAIKTAIQNKVFIMTGGPGTGKTTTTLGIITALKSSGAEILLAAPTGRAAKRLSEATGMEAKTIHRLLEASPPDGYKRNKDNPLEGDVLIVDECSMIDIILMNSLLKAIPDNMSLILVGDIDQLPSVGAGNVLRDIIDSGVFPVVRLTKIFRQAQSSRIITNAHKINRGYMPDISNGRNSDFFFIEQDDPTLAADEIVSLASKKLPAYYKTPIADIQILTPMQRGEIGAINLNQKLQEAINPENGGYHGNQKLPGLKRGGYSFNLGDKVMQIKNNYDKNVFNGDIGIIESVDTEERTLTINFDGKTAQYEAGDLDELVLAYATTIHKSQGSEYPIVIIPVMMSHYIMLQRNLIYTGITRAKKVLVIVGSKKALAYAVRNVTVSKRNTMLKHRLQKVADDKNIPQNWNITM